MCMTIFYSDVDPLSNYSPVMFHLSPTAEILNGNPDYCHYLTGCGFPVQ